MEGVESDGCNSGLTFEALTSEPVRIGVQDIVATDQEGTLLNKSIGP